MKRFYLQKHESDLIWSFGFRNQRCWICDMFHASLAKDGDRYYLPEDVFEDYGIVDHLEQLIGREVDIFDEE